MNIGHRHWIIADGLISRLGDETVAFLNVSPQEARVQVFIYYSNRDPVGPYHLTVPAKRMKRIPFSRLAESELIPPYACTIASDVPIVVQYPGFSSEVSSAKGTSAPCQRISSGANR